MESGNARPKRRRKSGRLGEVEKIREQSLLIYAQQLILHIFAAAAAARGMDVTMGKLALLLCG